MERVPPAAWLSEVIEPLSTRFGSQLTIDRDGDVVRWGFAGQYTVVELLHDGRLNATFLDRESVEAVSKRPAAAAYRTHVAYALNRGSCSRMVADMCDFFSGVREPKFRFIEAYARLPAAGNFPLSGTF